MHRSLKRRIADRALRSTGAVSLPNITTPDTLDATLVQRDSFFQRQANIATLVSMIVAFGALLSSVYQFKLSLEAQERAIQLQSTALNSDRSSKAAELFQKYVQIAEKIPPKGINEVETQEFRRARNNQALRALNAVYLVTKSDPQWQEVVSWQAQRYKVFVQGGGLECLKLTADFVALFKSYIPELDPRLCSDLSYD